MGVERQPKSIRIYVSYFKITKTIHRYQFIRLVYLIISLLKYDIVELRKIFKSFSFSISSPLERQIKGDG